MIYSFSGFLFSWLFAVRIARKSTFPFFGVLFCSDSSSSRSTTTTTIVWIVRTFLPRRGSPLFSPTCVFFISFGEDSREENYVFHVGNHENYALVFYPLFCISLHSFWLFQSLLCFYGMRWKEELLRGCFNGFFPAAVVFVVVELLLCFFFSVLLVDEGFYTFLFIRRKNIIYVYMYVYIYAQTH